MTENEGCSRDDDKNTCPEGDVAAYPDPDAAVNDVKHPEDEYRVENYHRKERETTYCIYFPVSFFDAGGLSFRHV
jgi:hypothetical protein